MIRYFSKILLAVVMLALVGCGGDGVEIAEVSGTVTMDGKPLPGAYVEFRPKEGGRPSGGVTDEEGYYELEYSVHESGARVGPAEVSITTGDLVNPQARPETVPARYNVESNLAVEVAPDGNEHNFELASN